MEPSKNAQKGLAISSKTKIEFPEICARCGVQTEKTIPVKITAGSPDHLGFEPIFLLGTPGHVAGAVNELLAGSAKIPCCHTCRRPYTIGYIFSLTCIAVIVALCYYGRPSDLDTTPTWLVIVDIFVLGLIFTGAILGSTIGQEIAAPVRIWLNASGYHYYFYSGAYRDWTQTQNAVC